MSEPTADDAPSDAQVEWSPRWYLWDGGFMALGRSRGVVPPHAHHAIQVVLGWEGEGRLRTEPGEWRSMRGGIVQPDVVHSFDGSGSLGCMLFVDPESREGRWLCASLREPITEVPEARLQAVLPPLRTHLESPLEAMEPEELVRHTVRSLCAGPPPSRSLDERVTKALGFIREAETGRLTQEEVAAHVYLSPSRFAHLFKEHVGLPFRRYLLWRKLQRAMVAIGHGRTLTAAAYQAGFSDSAHLTRTFYQMFGLPPSVMMRGEFFVVGGPFG